MPSDVKIELKLVSLGELKPHEETVSRLSERLIRTMIRDGVQRDPIIVDDKSRIVLDGMHRVRALTAMGARSAVCFLVPYMSDQVRLFSWYRFVESPGEQVVQEVVAELGAEEIQAPAGGGAPASGFTIYYRGRAYAPEVAGEFVEAVRAFDLAVRRRGGWVRYMDESTASPVLLKGDYMALITPRMTKEEVVLRGQRGRLLPPKTTLHVFPARPMGINYPISSLRDGTDILERILASRKMRTIESPSFYRSRLYREPVVVFE